MKTLLLLRHAKSSWGDPDQPDEQRPLNRRGRAAAKRMGRFLQEQSLLPDRIVCSTAVRTRQTWELLTVAWLHPVPVDFREDLYHASVDAIGAVLRQTPDECQRLLLIGHNPGLADFLAGATGYAKKFPTAALAWLTTDVAAWSEFQPRQPLELKDLWRPRDLDD